MKNVCTKTLMGNIQQYAMQGVILEHYCGSGSTRNRTLRRFRIKHSFLYRIRTLSKSFLVKSMLKLFFIKCFS